MLQNEESNLRSLENAHGAAAATATSAAVAAGLQLLPSGAAGDGLAERMSPGNRGASFSNQQSADLARYQMILVVSDCKKQGKN